MDALFGGQYPCTYGLIPQASINLQTYAVPHRREHLCSRQSLVLFFILVIWRTFRFPALASHAACVPRLALGKCCCNFHALLGIPTGRLRPVEVLMRSIATWLNIFLLLVDLAVVRIILCTGVRRVVSFNLALGTRRAAAHTQQRTGGV